MIKSMDNFEEYDNPERYDTENTWVGELELLEAWAPKDGLIIDLACGTGRVTIPLAEKGFTLMGVDLHEGMLQQAERKASGLELDIKWVHQDITALSLGVKCPMIYSVGNSFQHILTNEGQENLLKSVWNTLEDQGIFIFNTRFPSKEELMQPETEEYWRSYEDKDGRHIELSTIAVYDQVKQLQHYTTIRKFKNGVVESTTEITLRYTYPQELERLLRFSGFEILHIYQDWKNTELTQDALEMVVICRKA